MIDPQVVARLRKNPDFAALQRHISDAATELNRPPETKGRDDRAIAIEAIAREQARDTLAAILAPFVNYQERPDTSGAAAERAEDAGL
jgi:hypothetical protein